MQVLDSIVSSQQKTLPHIIGGIGVFIQVREQKSIDMARFFTYFKGCCKRIFCFIQMKRDRLEEVGEKNLIQYNMKLSNPTMSSKKYIIFLFRIVENGLGVKLKNVCIENIISMFIFCSDDLYFYSCVIRGMWQFTTPTDLYPITNIPKINHSCNFIFENFLSDIL